MLEYVEQLCGQEGVDVGGGGYGFNAKDWWIEE